MTLEPTEVGTLVTLVHEGLTEEQEASHAAGWEHFFERLERLSATGDAGQDEWDWIPERLDPVTASDAVLAAIQPVLRGLRPEHAGLPTPCRGMDCQQLTDHFRQSLADLGSMAGATVTDPEAGSDEDRISVMAAQAIDAWRSRGFDGSVPAAGGNQIPATFAVNVLPVELLLHGWDLAQATGRQLRVSDEVVTYVRELAGGVVPAARPNGSFAPEVEPHSDATPLDQLAAFAGRTPL